MSNLEANLTMSNLREANLIEANLTSANLSDTVASGSNLSGANLTRADLRKDFLSWADLSGSNLSGADLSESVIISPLYESARAPLRIGSNTSFHGAIIDDPVFIDYIRQYTNKIPEKIANKKELKMKLEGMSSYTDIQISVAVQGSRLPD
jgi:uncharacterized protein YjbI with pentapeptide repeats